MSIALRINLVFVAAALLMGGLIAVTGAFTDYNNQLSSLRDTTIAKLRGMPETQYLLYRQDRDKLTSILDELLYAEAVSAAVAYNSLGETLVVRNNPRARKRAALPFALIREQLLAADTALVTPDKDGEEIGDGLLTSIFKGDTPMYLSIPVVASINPGARGLRATDFGRALALGEKPESQWVVGYIHVLIDRQALVANAAAGMKQVIMLTLLFALVCCLAALYITRRITRPMRQLAELADRVASGNVAEPLEVDGASDMKELARIINSVVGGVSSFKKEHEVGRQLLSMKVEERSHQLSERSEALNRAVTEVEETRIQLHHLANYDSLTKLPNRNLLTEQLDLLLRLNRRNGHELALLFIDIDDFKRVNDSLGLRAGDQLLQLVAQRLSEAVRDSDSIGRFITPESSVGVSRLGGEEFTVVLNQVDSPDSAARVTRRLIEALKEPLTIDDHDIVIRPIVGIAMAPANGTDVETLLRAASTAKMHAHDTDTPFLFYSRELEGAGEERIRIESELRKAIERGELVLHYQPQVDTHSGSVVGAEALLRWDHGEMGLVPPGKFISMAEEIGLIREFGDWVLVEACRQIREFSEQGINVPRIAINVSARQFEPGFVERVEEVIAEAGIEASQLELGLTEAIMSSREQDTVEAIRSLKNLGVYLSVDDFGMGYSPINYLGRYPLDELKIDRSFLLDSSRSDNGAKLVIAIISLAKSLGLRVVASGVETEKEFHFLTRNGAHLIQGYLFSEPVPADALRPMLSAWHFIEQVQKLDNTEEAASRFA